MGSLALIIATPQGRTSSVMTATAEGCVATRSVYSTAYRQDASHDDLRGEFLHVCGEDVFFPSEHEFSFFLIVHS
jgi:hypothetical protein